MKKLIAILLVAVMVGVPSMSAAKKKRLKEWRECFPYRMSYCSKLPRVSA